MCHILCYDREEQENKNKQNKTKPPPNQTHTDPSLSHNYLSFGSFLINQAALFSVFGIG